MLRTIPVVIAIVLAAAPASAQLVQRDKPAGKTDAKAADGKDAKKGDKPADDDDILAPRKNFGADGKKVDDKPAEPDKPKSFNVGVVAIVPVGEAGKTLADKVTAGLLKELGAGHVFGAQALAVEIKGAAGGAATDEAAAKKALDEGKANAEKGQKALDNLKFGAAKSAFEAAIASFEKAAPVLADPQPLIDAHVALAEIATRQGQDDEAAAQLAKAAAFNPEQNLDKKKYPGAFVTTFDKARADLLKQKRGGVVVDTSAGGATIEIDGRPTAGAPVTVTELPVGRHVVRALREGLPAYGVVVEVKAGENATVSPGFVAKDAHSYVDDLQNNRFTADAAKAVAEAAKAAGLKGAVVGVVGKSGEQAPTQLVLVDAAGGMRKLPALAFTGDMLDISIETLKDRDAIEDAFEKPAWSSDVLATLLEGAKAGAGASMTTIAMRYDVQLQKAPTRARVIGDDKKHGDDDGGAVVAGGGDDGDGTKVLATGKSGTSQRIDDEQDPYATKKRNDTAIPDPDAPITEQAWFWPTVVGGGAGALVVLGGATIVTLVAAKVLPDPRPASGAEFHVVLP